MNTITVAVVALVVCGFFCFKAVKGKNHDDRRAAAFVAIVPGVAFVLVVVVNVLVATAADV